jgi:Adenosine deaminase
MNYLNPFRFLTMLLCLLPLSVLCSKEEMAIPADGFAFSSDIKLTSEEEKADFLIDSLRNILISEKGRDWGLFRSFVGYRDEARQSKLYRVIRSMPKGGLLHIHSSAACDADWLIDRAISMPDCYVYWGDKNQAAVKGELRFFHGETVPPGWSRIQELKATHAGLVEELHQLYTLGDEDQSVSNIWEEFEDIFARTGYMTSYRPVFVDYCLHCFNTMAEDGVLFAEVRTGLNAITNEDGTQSVNEKLLDVWREVARQVKMNHPSFVISVIAANSKGNTLENVSEDVTRINALKKKYPDLIVGYDLVAEEDAGNSNGFYSTALKKSEAPLFLHAGESLQKSNTNIQDAIDLGAQRIGHGTNLYYFPFLEKEIIEKDILLEVCPISNQALRYVPDFRLHPAIRYLQDGVQISLSSDDPMIFQSSLLTDDYFVAYLSWGLNLRSMKKMLLNSISHSGMNKTDKQAQLALFDEKWKTFIQNLNSGAITQ